MANGANRQSGETFAAPIGEAGQIRSANMKFSRTSPIGGIRMAAPIVLAQHKENERIGEARVTICSASPIVIEIA